MIFSLHTNILPSNDSKLPGRPSVDCLSVTSTFLLEHIFATSKHRKLRVLHQYRSKVYRVVEKSKNAFSHLFLVKFISRFPLQ